MVELTSAKATHDRDFLDPNIEPNLSIRTTFDQNIDSLAVKMVFHEHEELSAAFDTAIGDALDPMGSKKINLPLPQHHVYCGQRL